MNWLEPLSTLILCATGIYGINAWRREHVGTRRVELAEEVLALFYEADQVIRAMRHPASFGSETEHIKQNEGESERDYQARRNASIVYVRHERKSDLFNRIHAIRYRFMAQFGKDKVGPFDELHSVVNDVLHAATALARLWRQRDYRSEAEIDTINAQMREYEALFWSGPSESDPVQPRMDKTIAEIEAICRKEIESWEQQYWKVIRDKARAIIKR